jgi:AraC-like DNA-binding protein
MFRAATGLTPHQYGLERRIACAKQLLNERRTDLGSLRHTPKIVRLGLSRKPIDIRNSMDCAHTRDLLHRRTRRLYRLPGRDDVTLMDRLQPELFGHGKALDLDVSSGSTRSSEYFSHLDSDLNWRPSIRHNQAQSALRMPASISFHIRSAADRACFVIALGSGWRMPCSTSSNRPARSDAS